MFPFVQVVLELLHPKEISQDTKARYAYIHVHICATHTFEWSHDVKLIVFMCIFVHYIFVCIYMYNCLTQYIHDCACANLSCHSSKHAVPESSVVWTGATCQRHISLTANSLQTVKVFANFTKGGVYNLQNVKVWATREGSTDYHIQRWQRTSLISVVE